MSENRINISPSATALVSLPSTRTPTTAIRKLNVSGQHLYRVDTDVHRVHSAHQRLTCCRKTALFADFHLPKTVVKLSSTASGSPPPDSHLVELRHKVVETSHYIEPHHQAIPSVMYQGTTPSALGGGYYEIVFIVIRSMTRNGQSVR